eukprot:1137155-Pelagomonas_calceolata.AAC.1
MASFSSSQQAGKEAAKQRERELAAVKVAKEDVELVAHVRGFVFCFFAAFVLSDISHLQMHFMHMQESYDQMVMYATRQCKSSCTAIARAGATHVSLHD